MRSKTPNNPLQFTGIGMIMGGIVLCVVAGLKYMQIAEYYTPILQDAANPFNSIKIAPDQKDPTHLPQAETFLKEFARVQQEYLQAVKPVWAMGWTGAATSLVGVALLYAGKRHNFESNSVQVKGHYIQSSNVGHFVSNENVSGTVTNSISQLQSTDREQAWQLAHLLEKLQRLIETAPDFNNEDKVEALAQVKTLAEAGQNPNHGEAQSRARTAMKILKGTMAGLPVAAQLAVQCNELLTAITKLMGLG